MTRPGRIPGDPKDLLDDLGSQRFPDVYAGLWALPNDGYAVWRKPSPAFDEAVRRLPLTVPVEIRDARYSWRELEEVVLRIVADHDQWDGVEPPIIGVGPRGDWGAVLVTVLRPGGDLATAAARLVARYGFPAIDVQEGDRPVKLRGRRGWPVTPRPERRGNPRSFRARPSR